MREAIQYTMQFFSYEHLPPKLQDVSRPFSILAGHVAMGPMNIETFACLRKLLEAKDCAVRAAIAKPIKMQLEDTETLTETEEP